MHNRTSFRAESRVISFSRAAHSRGDIGGLKPIDTIAEIVYTTKVIYYRVKEGRLAG